MTMITSLYVTEPGTSIHKADERLVLRRENKVVDDIPLLNLEQVAIVGRGIDLSTEAMLALVDRKIDLCFFSRNFQLRARVSGEASFFGERRFHQARFVDQPARQLTLAKSIVRGKLSNQQRLLPPSQREVAKRMGHILHSLEGAKDLEALRGYEGQGAALYFEGLRKAFPLLQELGFDRRDFHPPPDPANALLSFGYTLLTREALKAVHLVGFDPYLGFFHAINFGRPSLALDMVEEFRPLTDALVIGLLTSKKIGAADFDRLRSAPSSERGETKLPAVPTWRLKPPARQRFLEAYEQQMATTLYYERESREQPLRRFFVLQMYHLLDVILGKTGEYHPVLFKFPN